MTCGSGAPKRVLSEEQEANHIQTSTAELSIKEPRAKIAEPGSETPPHSILTKIFTTPNVLCKDIHNSFLVLWAPPRARRPDPPETRPSTAFI